MNSLEEMELLERIRKEKNKISNRKKQRGKSYFLSGIKRIKS